MPSLNGAAQASDGFCEHVAAFSTLGEARGWLVENGYTLADSRRLKKNRGWLWNEQDGGIGQVKLERVAGGC